MNRISGVLLAIIALGASTSALAGNPLGAYVGFGVGASNVGNNNYGNGYGYGCGPYACYGYGGNYGTSVVSWKVMAGIRPLPIVGAELEYMDFGSSNGNNGYYNNYYYSGANTHPKATMLYGVGYLPLPLPYLDVFGKLGVARLQTNQSAYYNPSACPLPPPAAARARWSPASIKRTTSSLTAPVSKRNGRISPSAPNMRASARITAIPPRSRSA